MLGCHDSFLKVAASFCEYISLEGASYQLVLFPIAEKVASPEQVRNAGFSTWKQAENLTAALEGDEIKRANIVFLALDGKRHREFFLSYSSSDPYRPIFVTAYPGIVFRELLNGLLDRHPVDLLLLNSTEDKRKYDDVCRALKISSDNALVTGLPLLWMMPSRFKKSDPTGNEIKIVFFEQPSVPNSLLQRRYLAHALKILASNLPFAAIVIKPRVGPGEMTLHKNRGDLAELIGANVPPNLTVSYAPAIKLLSEASLVLTISSTAAIEAVAMGIPTRIITDLGVNETLGNSYFANSGMLATFQSVTGFEALSADNSWMQSHASLPIPLELQDLIVSRILQLLNSVREPVSRASLAIGSSQWISFAEQVAGGISGPASGEVYSGGTVRGIVRKSNAARMIYRSIKRVFVSPRK